MVHDVAVTAQCGGPTLAPTATAPNSRRPEQPPPRTAAAPNRRRPAAIATTPVSPPFARPAPLCEEAIRSTATAASAQGETRHGHGVHP
jgi:hypothetical protein